MGKVVLVTGAARELGVRFVRRVQREPDVDRVVAVDAVEPVRGLGAASFVRADIRQPSIGTVLAEHAVDTVVHLDAQGAGPEGRAAGRAFAKEINVIGAMQLLGACQKAPAVRRLVIKSTTGVYGSAPRDPTVFDEQTVPGALPASGFAKDAVEVEGYVRGFARRRPDVAVTVLRFAHILGPARESPLAACFAQPVLPTALGHDPRLQFVHDDDAVEALRLAAGEPRAGTVNAGTFNIAGAGVLLLSQCARRLGLLTVPVPLPALRWGGGVLRRAGALELSAEQLRLLTHGRVVSTVRAREVLGFTPRRSTQETLAAFARERGAGPLPPGLLGGAVDRAAAVLAGARVRPPHRQEAERND
ncbi:NAD-dependent dehydratase [Streptomyces sp. NHF165]|uniref:NAD-dependent epimerase/dehydratase family protein n=1 Tax=Streptomyces TaxID=1883 RepID=UPI00068A089D|nr:MULTISPECIES: NAD-dependent epimerase/dehydratase family protein [Streptomyces]QHF97699.1 NAD-dependent dehydratase [Streptomyces sp. NHF165]